MIREYIPVLLQAIVAIGFAAGALIVSVLLGKSGMRTQTQRTPPTSAAWWRKAKRSRVSASSSTS